MEKFDKAKTDFHALNVLVTVHRLGSVSAAANLLGLNQSTVSYTLERLRRVFADELFVRMGKGIVPTERCEEIARGANDLLLRFSDLTKPDVFDPATSSERLTLSINFYERQVIVPALFHALWAEAPNLRLAVIQSNSRGHAQLLDNECDLLISPLVTDMSGLYTRRLFEERYACVVDRNSRAARHGLTLEQYAAARHVTVNYTGGWQPFYREALRNLGIVIDPALELPSFGSAQKVVEGTDLVLTVPAALVPSFTDSCVALPTPFECCFTLSMFWSGRTHESAVNRWLRTHVVRTARMVAAEHGMRL